MLYTVLLQTSFVYLVLTVTVVVEQIEMFTVLQEFNTVYPVLLPSTTEDFTMFEIKAERSGLGWKVL